MTDVAMAFLGTYLDLGALPRRTRRGLTPICAAATTAADSTTTTT